MSTAPANVKALETGSGIAWDDWVEWLDSIGAGGTQFLLTAEAPQHAHRCHAVMAGTLDVQVPVTDHHRLGGRGAGTAQGFGHQLRLVAAAAIGGSADDLLEQRTERQVLQNPARMRLVLRRHQTQPGTVVVQRAHGRGQRIERSPQQGLEQRRRHAIQARVAMRPVRPSRRYE